MQQSTYRWMAGKPLIPAGMELAKRLRPHGIRPVAFWDSEDGSVQGYAFEDLRKVLPDVVALVEDEDGAENLPL